MYRKTPIKAPFPCEQHREWRAGDGTHGGPIQSAMF